MLQYDLYANLHKIIDFSVGYDRSPTCCTPPIHIEIGAATPRHTLTDPIDGSHSGLPYIASQMYVRQYDRNPQA
jgi:hypothetical protein